MAISISGTTLTFNDATTQTTARTASNTVTSIVAGTGITVSGATGAVTVNASGSGTVTSVATGNGLSGGTITSTGTLVVACPTHNSVGSYCMGGVRNNNNSAMTITFGTNYAAGASNVSNVQGISMIATYTSDNPPGYNQPGPQSLDNVLSGTWKWMNPTITTGGCGRWYVYGLLCRVS